MTTLIPTSSACYTLQLPLPDKDDRLNLNVRTGSASVLHNSFVFTFGGLTIGLELDNTVTVDGIVRLFVHNVGGNKPKKLRNYLSGELFYLDLILRAWSRVTVPPGAPRPKPRLFHELAKGNGCIYVFGGLVIPDDAQDDVLLVPCNDLWEFNLSSGLWRLLHDGTGYETDPAVPAPRFCHKMTLIDSLAFAKMSDHYGLMIAGGLGLESQPLYDNAVFDVVEKTYTTAGTPLVFSATTDDPEKDKKSGLACFSATDGARNVNVNYLNSIIVNYREEVEYHLHSTHQRPEGTVISPNLSAIEEESVIIYSPTSELQSDVPLNPLLSFRVGRKFGKGKVLPLHKKRTRQLLHASRRILHQTIPHNLRYPTGGLFGRNLVITGFLPNDFDISIFIYNKPTGKWSRLNIFCNHDYGSHRFWGGFAWTSHHKVVLLGNYVTLRTTSSVRYFSLMITVSLPVTNILASMEMAGEALHTPVSKLLGENSTASDTDSFSSTEESSSSLLQISDMETADLPESHPVRRFSNMSAKSDLQKNLAQNPVNFSEYVHYAAPKVNFTKVRSVFPPAAITLGRNAFDRYGDPISDFELISSNGDRIPVCLSVLTERWGKYFIDLLARAYVRVIDKFEQDQAQGNAEYRLRSSKSSGSSVGSRVGKFPSHSGSDVSHDAPDEKHQVQLQIHKPSQKEAPQFRLPFQESHSTSSLNSRDSNSGSIDPHKTPDRKNSISSHASSSSVIKNFLEIPPQLPLPSEPTPAVPATPTSFRSSSRKNSTDATSPRASLLHTLSVLRSIPKSPKDSPFHSPRGSISVNHESKHPEDIAVQKELKLPEHHFDAAEFMTSDSDKEKSNRSPGSPKKQTKAQESINSKSPSSNAGFSASEDGFHGLLDFQNTDPESFKLEPSLIPRKLYIPFGTNSLKAFAEYLYTGQVGNKWILRPCALDCLLMARYFKVPLLYDLICEVLYGIIGRKEAFVIKEGKKYKKKFNELFEKTHSHIKSTFRFPLDEYEGFMDTVDDGYLDIALLRKLSNMHKDSVTSVSSRRRSTQSKSRSSTARNLLASEPPQRLQDVPLSPKTEDVETTTSEDDNRSSGDDDGPALHFLDYNDRRSNIGPRSKSIFDKTAYDNAMQSFFDNDEEDISDEKERVYVTTLEMLVLPNSPEPSNYVIDLIYEAASMCTDVKLMLRAKNARHMGFALKQTKQEYQSLLKSMRNNLENVAEIEAEDDLDITRPAQRPSLISKPLSATSLGGSRSADSTPTEEQIELHNSPRRLTDLSRTSTGTMKMTPFKAVRAESVENNKDLDRRIAQMIKKDEKLKQKAAREEKVRRNNLEKERKRAPTILFNKHEKPEEISDAASIFSKSTTSAMSATQNKHRLFRFGGKPKHKDSIASDTLAESAPIGRVQSTVSLNSEKSNSSKKSAGSKKGLFGLRKR